MARKGDGKRLAVGSLRSSSKISAHEETRHTSFTGPLAPDAIAAVCRGLIPDPKHRSLVEGLNRIDAEHAFSLALTAAPWYRIGGVVTAKGARVANDLADWAYHETQGDLSDLLAKCDEERLFATRVEGRTVYLTARTGRHACEFIQIEVEETQEVLERPLFGDEWMPEDLEDFIDPLMTDTVRKDLGHHQPLEGRPLGPPRYGFGNVTWIRSFFEEMARYRDVPSPAERFLADWDQSSAGRHHTFCFHWVLELHEHVGHLGERRLDATPRSLGGSAIPQLRVGPETRGTRLANALHNFDRKLGYPFAWYFHMLRRDRVPSAIATAVLSDLRDDYAYLPEEDVQVLEQWNKDPYHL